jgi:hypothetical protein
VKLERREVVALVLLLVLLLAPRVIGELPNGNKGPVDLVIAVYESKNQPVAEASVMAGVTVQAIDKAGKWRQYDKDQIPADKQPILNPVVAKLGIPCVAFVRKNRVDSSAKLPDSDAGLSELVRKNGGYQ